MNNRKWIMRHAPRPDAKLRLYGIPYAGGGATIFRQWHALLPDTIELVGVQLPGRESRFMERPMTVLANVVASLVDVVTEFDDLPFYLFGHSMGALVAYELARALEKVGGPQPFHLVVSGMRAPQLPAREAPLHALSDEEFFAKVREFNGLPAAVAADDALMQLFMPQLRADFALFETYRRVDATPLACDVTAFGGNADPGVTLDELDAWKETTRGRFNRHVFPGDHFFIQPQRHLLLPILASIGNMSPIVPGNIPLNIAPSRNQPA